jgi:hypothetical protein
MAIPDVLGRQEDDAFEPDPRASSKLIHSVSVPFEAGAIGEVKVEVFRSVDEGDRGGIVIRATLKDEASSFVPHAKLIPSGVELHMAGDIEAKSLIDAMKAALAAL